MKPAWPYFGAKTAAAETIWRLLGDPPLYVEPFCGTCAALLGRPGWRPGLRRSEIANDADGLLVNTLRAIRYQPSIVLRHAGTQNSEIDMHGRSRPVRARRRHHLGAGRAMVPHRSPRRLAHHRLRLRGRPSRPRAGRMDRPSRGRRQRRLQPRRRPQPRNTLGLPRLHGHCADAMLTP